MPCWLIVSVNGRTGSFLPFSWTTHSVPDAMIVVHNLILANQAAPTLWTGRVGEHGLIAIHFRWGTLTVRVSHTSNDPYAEDSELVFESPIDENENAPGRESDSCIGEARMKEALQNVCLFPS
jgi:hypothetical protein